MPTHPDAIETLEQHAAKRPTKAMLKQAAREQARADLLKLLKPGMTVYTSLDHVSRSGMMRHIRVLVGSGADILDLSYKVSVLLDDRTTDRGALKIGGCGMDMGFHVVYALKQRWL